MNVRRVQAMYGPLPIFHVMLERKSVEGRNWIFHNVDNPAAQKCGCASNRSRQAPPEELEKNLFVSPFHRGAELVCEHVTGKMLRA
jgi:hypothetical protein